MFQGEIIVDLKGASSSCFIHARRFIVKKKAQSYCDFKFLFSDSSFIFIAAVTGRIQNSESLKVFI